MSFLFKQLETITASLKEARQRVLRLETEYRKIIDIFSQEISASGKRYRITSPNDRWKDRVLSFLEKNIDKEFGAKEITQALEVFNPYASTIRSTLFLLAKEGRILKQKPGIFKAKKDNIQEEKK